jgi:hypothetical protein
MIDKTTAGITAEPEEVEAVLHNLCGYHLAERDPVFRYTVLTREQVLYDALVAAIKRERGRALSELVASGTTLTHAAQMTNLSSRQQVQRLIGIAKAAAAAAAEVRAASRDFEDRLAAVEATLDEVVSGIVAPAEESPVDGSDGAAVASAAADPVEVPAATAEPTQTPPSLTAVIHPTREVLTADDSRWWRRGRDSGAA